MPDPIIRTHESNLMFFKMYGNAHRWIKFEPSIRAFEVPGYLKDNQKYQVASVFEYNYMAEINCLHLDLDVRGYAGHLSPVRNLFFSDLKKISLKSVERC